MTGWDESAAAWIRHMGERGDWAREWVLDPVLLGHVEGRGFADALDVGCGEGRFCRLLRARGIDAVGIDAAPAMIAEARRRDPAGCYEVARAEALPFPAARFDLAVSCLSLLDIAGFREAIMEMARVLRPGGTLLAANLSSFFTAGPPDGWERDGQGRRLRFPIDRYLEEREDRVRFSGIDVVNWHRPLGAYMTAFLGAGLILRAFEEPVPKGGDPERAAAYRRVPWFTLMAWEKPA